MSEKLLINVNVSGEGDLNKLDKTMEGVAGSTKKAASEITNIRKQIKDAKNEMLKYEEGTKEYNNALSRAGQLQFKLKDINDKTKLSVRDFGQTAKNVGQTVAGLGGVFGVVQGSMALFGVENEATLKTLQNLTAGLSIFQGLATFADSIDSMKDLFNSLKASSLAAEGTTTTISELNKVSEAGANSMGNIAKESAVLGSNLAGVSVSSDNMNKAVLNSTNEIKKYTKSEFDALSIQEQRIAKIREINPEFFKQKEITEKLNDSTNNLNKTTEAGAKATEQVGTSIGKTMLTMGLITIAIGAVIYGITSLIEWMNKVPEDVKLKIAIDEESLKNTIKSRILISEIKQDLNNIEKRTDINAKNQLKNIKEVMVQNKIASNEEIKNLSAKELLNNKFFERYLKKIEDVARQEVIIKQKVEAQVSSETSLSKAKELFKTASSTKDLKGTITPKGSARKFTWKQLVKYAYDGSFTNEMEEALLIWGVAQDVIDSLKNVAAQNGIIKELNKLQKKQSKNIFVVEPTTKTTTKTTSKKATYTPEKIEEVPEVITAKLTRAELIKMEKARLEDLTYSEKIEKEIADRRLNNSNNVFLEIDNNLKRNTANLIDNNIEQEKSLIIIGKYDSVVKDFDKTNKIYNSSVEEGNNIEKNKTDLINKLAVETIKLKKLDEDYKNKDINTNKEKSKTLKDLYDAQLIVVNGIKDGISIYEDAIIVNKAEQNSLLEKLKTLKEGTKEYEDAYNSLKKLELERSLILETGTDLEKQKWTERIKSVQEYGAAIGDLAGGLASITQGNMDLTNQEYDAKIWANDEMVQSDEDRAKNAEKIEKQRYEALKKDFELKKKYEIAQAWINFASGSVGIWSGVNSKTGPAGIVLAGIQQAALLATTIGSIKTIQAQTLQAPHSASKSSASTSTASSVSIAPPKSSLTSKEENLNMMNKNGERSSSIIVKVSDINKVQDNVKVRENNSGF